MSKLASAVALTVAVTGMMAGAGRAMADPGNKNTLSITLDCGASGSVDAVFELSSSDSFHTLSTNSNFVWKSLSFIADGQTITIERGGQGGGHKDLVTCTYTGPVSGNHYTVVGFFTPES